MPGENEIRDELLSSFPQAFGDSAEESSRGMLDACVKMAHLLTSYNAVVGLMKIDTQMRSRCGIFSPSAKAYYAALSDYCYGHGDKNAKEIKSMQKSVDMGSKKNIEALQRAKLLKNTTRPLSTLKPTKNLLTGVMAAIETEAGFGDSGAKTDTLLGFEKNSDAFRARISQGRMMKDPTVPGWHGEHTHRLQWAIAQVCGIPDVPKLYRFIGSVVFEKDKKRGLWDAICDRDGDEASFVPFKADIELKKMNRDFRAPELLTKFICQDSSEDTMPLLHMYIKARVHKRHLYPLENETKNEYVLKKLFPGKSLRDLDEAEQRHFTEVIAQDFIMG